MAKDISRLGIIIGNLEQKIANVESVSGVSVAKIDRLSTKVRNLETTPIGGVSSYNDLTDKPTIPVLADISKAEIEAKLTGEISSHTHAGGSGLTQAQALTMGLL